MEETNRTYLDEEGDETIVAPRFDDEETVLARPVVPLGEVGDAPAELPAARPLKTAPTPLYTRLRGTPRRSFVAALVLVSALAGSVLGVGGLYLYQKQRNAAAEPSEQQMSETPAPVAQPTSEAGPQNQTSSAQGPEPQASAPAAARETNAQDKKENASDSAKDKDSEKDEESPIVERRDASEDRDSAATRKRGKKGSREEESQREERRARRDDEQSARDDDATARPEARRVGVITYRSRRVGPRRGPYADTDRLRRIFEGQP